MLNPVYTELIKAKPPSKRLECFLEVSNKQANKQNQGSNYCLMSVATETVNVNVATRFGGFTRSRSAADVMNEYPTMGDITAVVPVVSKTFHRDDQDNGGPHNHHHRVHHLSSASSKSSRSNRTTGGSSHGESSSSSSSSRRSKSSHKRSDQLSPPRNSSSSHSQSHGSRSHNKKRLHRKSSSTSTSKSSGSSANSSISASPSNRNAGGDHESITVSPGARDCVDTKDKGQRQQEREERKEERRQRRRERHERELQRQQEHATEQQCQLDSHQLELEQKQREQVSMLVDEQEDKPEDASAQVPKKRVSFGIGPDGIVGGSTHWFWNENHPELWWSEDELFSTLRECMKTVQELRVGLAGRDYIKSITKLYHSYKATVTEAQTAQSLQVVANMPQARGLELHVAQKLRAVTTKQRQSVLELQERLRNPALLPQASLLSPQQDDQCAVLLRKEAMKHSRPCRQFAFMIAQYDAYEALKCSLSSWRE